MTDDLSAAIESGYNPSSANTAMFVADLCTPSIYLAYFICTLLGIKESYFNSTLTFPFIKVNSDQTSLQYKRIGCTQALKSLLSDNQDFCMQNIALHAFLIADRLLPSYDKMSFALVLFVVAAAE